MVSEKDGLITRPKKTAKDARPLPLAATLASGATWRRKLARTDALKLCACMEKNPLKIAGVVNEVCSFSYIYA